MTVFKHAVWSGPGRGRVLTLSFLVKDAAKSYVALFRESSPLPLAECELDHSLVLGGISLAACGLDDQRGMAIAQYVSRTHSSKPPD